MTATGQKTLVYNLINNGECVSLAFSSIMMYYLKQILTKLHIPSLYITLSLLLSLTAILASDSVSSFGVNP